MTNFMDIFLFKSQNYSHEIVEPSILFQNSQDSVYQYLNDSVLIDSQIEIHEFSFIKEQYNSKISENQLPQPPQHETTVHKRKKSIFHNFQKHIITIIKNFIIIDNYQIEDDLNKYLRKQLWEAFKKQHSFNKRCLHIIFGVSQTEQVFNQFQKLAKQYAYFRIIYHNNSIEDIINAQNCLRKQIAYEISHMSKSLIEINCQVNRFEEFYEYLRSFMIEISEGPMKKRMTKIRKHELIRKLKDQDRKY